jgi:hypothetical protein
MKWGRSTIYPNLYIILVGPSGRAKKGTALDFAKPILQAINIPLVAGAITREKLIRRMAGAISNYQDGTTGLPMFQCGMTCISSELSVFLGQNNIKFLADLCDWYDCLPTWEYDTKHFGTDKLDGVYFNLIAATAPDWLPSILPREAVGGGFTSRVIWVVEEEKRATVVFPTCDEELEKLLIHDLEDIHLISSEFKFTPEAADAYATWYKQADDDIRRGNPPIPDPKFAGYCDRRATLVKKLSMITSVSEDSEPIIELRHFQRAVKLMESVEKKMPRAFSGLGEARYVYASELLLNFLATHKRATRTQILSLFFRDIDSYTFEVITKTLYQRGLIDIQPVETHGRRDIAIELVKDPLA